MSCKILFHSRSLIIEPYEACLTPYQYSMNLGKGNTGNGKPSVDALYFSVPDSGMGCKGRTK